MEIQLSEIMQSNYCYYDLHSGCVKELEMPDAAVCSKCAADVFAEIVRL